MKKFKNFQLKYNIGDYVKRHEDRGYNSLPIIKILDGSGVFKNITPSDYYVSIYLTNLHNPKMSFESKWIELWITDDSIERLSSRDEFVMQEELIKYNL